MATEGGDPEQKQQELMLYVLSQECKSMDKMWQDTGVEHEDLEEAIQRLKL
jgi:hypothetical protein